jgi:hypothetical protein
MKIVNFEVACLKNTFLLVFALFTMKIPVF